MSKLFVLGLGLLAAPSAFADVPAASEQTATTEPHQALTPDEALEILDNITITEDTETLEATETVEVSAQENFLVETASPEPEALTPEPTELPDPLATEIEFGYQSHTGNSDSRSLNGRLKGEYTAGRHRTSGEWKYYNLYKDGEEDKRQSTYTAQSDYKLSPKTYLYGSFKGVDSRYSAYFKDYTVSTGLGYQFSNTERFVFELEVGPGFRYQEPNLDEIDDDDIIFPEIVEEGIFRGNINTAWQALPNLRFTADMTLVSGSSNLRLDTDLEAINDITENIALKIAYSRQYHDKVPEGLEKGDSVLSVNLLFQF